MLLTVIAALLVFNFLDRPVRQTAGQQPALIQQQTNSPHATIVAEIEEEAGVNLSRLASHIIADEGIRTSPYLDSTRNVTIGVGRNLTGHGITKLELKSIVPNVNWELVVEHTHVRNQQILIDSLSAANDIFTKKLSRHDVALLLISDLKDARTTASSFFPDVWERIGATRQEVVTSLVFQLGSGGFAGFHHFIAAVKAEDWVTASNELLLSKAARQAPARFHRMATEIRTGGRR